MAKLTPKDFLDKAKLILGDRTDDDALSFLEDCKDTITDDKDGEDWKSKYDDLVKEKDELDKSWRQKYRDRFFSADNPKSDNDTNPSNHANDNTDEIDVEEEAKKIRFDDLFTEE